MPVSAAPARALDRPVQYLKGVGPKRAELLERLGLRTLSDIVSHFPRSWEERLETPPGVMPQDSPLVLKGRVAETFSRRVGSGLCLFIAKLAVPAHGLVEALWFKRPSRRYDVFQGLARDLARGTDVWVIGRGEPGLLKARSITVSEHYLAEDPKTPLHVGKLIPIYPSTQGLPERFLRELAAAALEEALPEIREFLPERFMRRGAFLTLPQALRGIHRPGSKAELEQARRRLAYEELFILELGWSLKQRQTREAAKPHSYEIKRSLLSPFRASLGFELTRAQKRVVNEIFDDMRRPYPMMRLLQGDVGSGKTVVAVAAALLAAENGRQTAFMAPTEILAEQHHATLSAVLRELPVKSGLLTSSVPKAKRERLLAAAAAGEIDILVGTHALLETSLSFKNLSLAVIDEQHRFGVRQRATLRQKGPPLDLLMMTATPIPRTLSLALYGDLEVSTLDEMPPGRTPPATRHVGEGTALDAVRAAAALGRQSYIVYPIISESAKLDLKAAANDFDRLSKGELKGLRCALVHGRLPGKKKVSVMEEFARGELDVLVATSVIEVGVDVPNATVMVIQNADRFGLASLHQLRGRIGRGVGESLCCLVADPKSPEARRRLKILCETSDGFKISEEDLKLRGPGELLGIAQHGELGLKAADLAKDSELLALAKEDAGTALAGDPMLRSEEMRPLRERLAALYRDLWDSIDPA